jgi:uncharacterized protein YqkB
MDIQITPVAEQQLKQKIDNEAGELVLVYDSEGCGCAVSGIPQLWLVHPLEEEDTAANCETLQLYYKPRQAIFFDESMRIDYSHDKKNFKLSSPGQIFNANMNVIDKR